jgi:hypothetical protein
VTERRDPHLFSNAPRAPGEPLRKSIPFARLAAGPHLSRRRLSVALAAAVLLILCGWAAWSLLLGARDWLHRRPEYAVPFDRIVLDPPPPPVLRSGREAILGRVRERAKLRDPIPLLDQDLEELGLAFAKYSPWVAKVVRVERTHPDRITVRLVYRKPVARINLTIRDFLAIADDGVVLPGEDLRASDADRLVRIDGIRPPLEARPGHFLGANDAGKVPPEIVFAIRLARFLHDQEPDLPPRIAAINVTNGLERIVLKTRRGVWVHWGNAPGDEKEGEPKAAEKYEQLKRWEESHGNPASRTDYLVFTRDGARLHSEL